MAPPRAIGMLHYYEPQIYKAHKALVAAKFNSVTLEAKVFNPDKDAKKPDFLAKNPTGKVPFFETDRGCLFTSNAIARYVARCRADTPLYGRSFDEEGQIDTWVEFCTHDLEIPLMAWLYPVMGLMEEVPAATVVAKADVKKAFGTLEDRLGGSEFLIGDCVTLADIVVVCALKEGMVRIFDDAFKKPFPKTCLWFQKCCAMPHFKAVLGEVPLCKTAEKAQKFAPPARKDEKKDEKKAGASPKANPSAAPKAAAVAPAVGSDVDAQIKKVGDEIRDLKAKFKAEGMGGKAIDKTPEVMAKVAELQALKVAQAAGGSSASTAPATKGSPMKEPAAAPAGGDAEAKIKAVGDEIRVLKEKLKGDGLSGKKINDHDEIKRLVAELQTLKATAPAAATPAPDAAAAAAAGAASPGSPKQTGAKSPKGSPKKAPAASPGGGDIAAQVTAVGDEIRMLKEKLKAEGLSGKKINDHADIKAKVAELQTLKAQLLA